MVVLEAWGAGIRAVASTKSAPPHPTCSMSVWLRCVICALSPSPARPPVPPGPPVDHPGPQELLASASVLATWEEAALRATEGQEGCSSQPYRSAGPGEVCGRIWVFLGCRTARDAAGKAKDGAQPVSRTGHNRR